jgi:antitoxin ParD1/3/4
MPTRNVVLSDEQDRIIRELVEDGHYQNASEVIRAGIRLVLSREEEERARIEGLRKAIDSGLSQADRGELIDYDPSVLDAIEDEIDRG